MLQTKLPGLANFLAGCILFAFVTPAPIRAAADVLIVADEMPQMELLVKILKSRANTTADLVTQANVPATITGYRAVFAFVHHELLESAEKPMVDYANAGGKLIVLHHSISWARAKNKYWFPFLGMSLTPPGDPEQGFYKYYSPVTYTVVNLAPGNFITSHNVKYEGKTTYTSSDLGTPEQEYPSFTLTGSEVYVNHKFIDGKDKTILMGFKWQDPKTGKVWMQDRSGWLKKAGKGWIIYLQPGHSITDFENSTYSQIVLNALEAKLN
jgi:hypothetical protein